MGSYVFFNLMATTFQSNGNNCELPADPAYSPPGLLVTSNTHNVYYYQNGFRVFQ